jgi:3-hydroxybutyryl-CoA dehydrogenase
MTTDRSTSVAIIGAGTMGAGIAQVAATAGWSVHLMDVDEATVRAAINGIAKRLDRLVEKGRIDTPERDAIAGRLHVAAAPSDLACCHLVIEAVVEDIELKASVLGELLPSLPDDCIIATNTSSLSVTAIGEHIGRPGRTVGMHFFNPAPVMALVEVVAGTLTEPAVVYEVVGIATKWGKTVALAADVPGFIVNHVARPYYLEAFRILEDGYARPEDIDIAMETMGSFRMGPLKLTDFIGQDVNAATTRSVWLQLRRPPLLAPCPVQDKLVLEGHLGRKTGRGVYDYEVDPPKPALEIQVHHIEASGELRAAVDAFVAAASEINGTSLQRYLFARILVAVIVQATLARDRGVANATDIDTALKAGVNYPRGPFQWAEQIGNETICRLLDCLNETVDDDRFAVPESMKANA